ncbi:cylicin-1-like isoform X2 [Mytilus edulis]|uniref:cylicin-1-like isoform X2 n=1 Tax=Mytilus edulis TaxID=6550 RepID=UPI0039F0DFA8
MAMKRRLSDYLQGNNLPVSTDSGAVPLYRAQKVSFKLFQQKETVHMKSLYPFLTKSQINSKVRELWKNMSADERQNFSKTVLTKTPTKSSPFAKQTKRMGSNSSRDRRSKCSIWTDQKTEVTSPVYKSDFDSQNITSSPNWLTETSPIPATKDYTKTKYQPDNVIPEIIDETPNKQPGILKQTENIGYEETTPPSKKKTKVSFSPSKTTTASMLSEVNSSPVSSQGFSSEEDSTLIRRNSCNFDDIDNFSICIESDDPMSVATHLVVKEEVQESEKDNDRIKAVLVKNNSKDDGKKVDIINEIKSSKKSPKDKKNKNLSAKKLSPEIISTRRTRSAQSTSQPENSQFTTPMTFKSNKNSNSTKSDISNFTTPLILKPNSNNLTAKSDIQQYTTPMMDDATMQQLLDEAKQAPKKRRSKGGDKNQNKEDIDNDSTTDLKKHKARTSLLCPDEVENNFIIDASGDAKVNITDNEKATDSQLSMPKYSCEGNMPDVLDSDNEKTRLSDFEVPSFPPTGAYFRVPDEVEDVELSDSDNDNALETCKSKSTFSVMETLKRMKEATWKQISPIKCSPVMSPKILSPALSGISQLSSASSDSKVSFVESGHSKDNSNDAEPENTEPVVQTNMYQNQKTTLETNQHKEKLTISQKQEYPKTYKEDLEKLENISTSSEKQNIPLSHDNDIASKQENRSDEVTKETMTKTDMLSDCCPKESLEANENMNEIVLETKVIRTKKITRIARRKTPNKNQEMINSKCSYTREQQLQFTV